MLDQPASHALVPAPRVTDQIPRKRDLALVGILAWILPGLGHVAMGRHGKALVMLTAIGGLFVSGLWLTGFTCVDPHEYRLEFVAQIFAGGPTLLAQHLTENASVTAFLPHFDVGRLYVDVAGLLNIVAISDALGLALAHNARVTSLRQLAWKRAEAAAPTLSDTEPSGPFVGEEPPSDEHVDEVLPSEHDVFPAFGWDTDHTGEERT